MTSDRRARVETAAALLARSMRARTERPRADLDERLTSALRVVVSVAGFAIFRVAADETTPRRPLAYAILGAFVLYSGVNHLLMLRHTRRPSPAVAPWIDLAFATLVVMVSDDDGGVFFALYLFAILVGAFHGGLRRGMALMGASIVSFSAVAVVPAALRSQVELDEILVRPLHLLLLGLLIAYWGEHERRLRARVDLLRDVTTLSNPRFGEDSIIGRFLTKLRAYYDAETCRLVVEDAEKSECWSRAASRGAPGASAATQLPPPLAQMLLPHPSTGVLLFGLTHGVTGLGRRRGFQILEPGGAPSNAQPEPAMGEALATALGVKSFVSLPFRYHTAAVARIFLAWRHSRAFDRADMDFLIQVIQQVAPVLENARLVDRLALDAADEERRRIARDIHDSVIQPYIGLHLGVSAAGRALRAGRTDEAQEHLQRLSELAEAEVASLRGYVHALTDRADDRRGVALTGAVKRFCGRFTHATGILVQVETDAPQLNERLAAEVFQMVTEGLSNVRRHSEASRARVRIVARNGRLRLFIENDGAPVASRVEFSPRSLRERTNALGGELQVGYQQPDITTVHIEIPL